VTTARREPGFGEHSEAHTLFRRGVGFLDRGHPGQAAHLLERALILEPGRNSIREALGRSLYALGEIERAASQFEAIVAAAPDNDYAQYALGRCLLRLGREEEARGCLRLAAALAPRRRGYAEGPEAVD